MRPRSSPTAPFFGPNSNVAAHVAALTLSHSDVLVWQHFLSVAEFRLERWDEDSGDFVLEPGSAWQQCERNQANEDSFAVNPFQFTSKSWNKQYNLRTWKVDAHSPAGGRYDTGKKITGDLQRAMAHQTVPIFQLTGTSEDRSWEGP